jgi:hypothetical protein
MEIRPVYFICGAGCAGGCDPGRLFLHINLGNSSFMKIGFEYLYA